MKTNVKNAYPENLIEALRNEGAKISAALPSDVVGTIDYILTEQNATAGDMVRMYYRDGYVYREIGEKFNMTAQAAEKRIAKCIKALATNKNAMKLLGEGVTEAIQPGRKIRRNRAMKALISGLSARNFSIREIGLKLPLMIKLEKKGFYDTASIRKCGRAGLKNLAGITERDIANIIAVFARNGVCYDELLDFRTDSNSVTALNMSAGATNALLRSGIKTVDQLSNVSIEFLAGIKDIGRSRATEIVTRMAELGRPIKGVYTVGTALQYAYKKHGKSN